VSSKEGSASHGVVEIDGERRRPDELGFGRGGERKRERNESRCGRGGGRGPAVEEGAGSEEGVGRRRRRRARDGGGGEGKFWQRFARKIEVLPGRVSARGGRQAFIGQGL
jgi:hypothetical protein